MNTAEAVRALDAAAERVVSFGMRNNFHHSGQFFVYAHELDQKAVDAAQAQEREKNPGLPLVATAGMKAGTHVALIEAKDLEDFRNRTVWMSTHEAEKTTQAEFVARARGRVLIAGFGLGLVTDAVLAKPEVTEVVVVEKNIEVTNVMSPLLDQLEDRHRNKRFKVAYADIFKYKPTRKFDTIYFDIWPTISAQNLPDMVRLRQRYARWLGAGGWMGCWVEKECRNELLKLRKRHGSRVDRIMAMVDKEFGWNNVVSMCNIDEGGS